MRFPVHFRVIHRLVAELLDAREHNEYLSRTNGRLTETNSRLSAALVTQEWHIYDLERALTRVGTEDE